MRFAWQKKQLTESEVKDISDKFRFVHLFYNTIWWIPIVLAFIGIISYEAGFITFSLITLLRLIANIYRNNFLEFNKALYFPFRS